MSELPVFYWANSTRTELFNFTYGNYLVVHSTKNCSHTSIRLSVSHFVSSYKPNFSFCTRLFVLQRAPFTPRIPHLSFNFIRTPFKINMYYYLIKYYKSIYESEVILAIKSGVASLGKWFPTFRNVVLVSFQGSKFPLSRKT